jgi:hypothetical protein
MKNTSPPTFRNVVARSTVRCDESARFARRSLTRSTQVLDRLKPSKLVDPSRSATN